jgi:hypothetical protein
VSINTNIERTVQPRKKGDKPQVKLPLVVACAASLMVYLGWLGASVFSPVTSPENDMTRKHDAFIAKIAKEAGPTADISKINPIDRAKFLNDLKGAPRTPESVLKQYIQAHPVR